MLLNYASFFFLNATQAAAADMSITTAKRAIWLSSPVFTFLSVDEFPPVAVELPSPGTSVSFPPEIA